MQADGRLLKQGFQYLSCDKLVSYKISLASAGQPLENEKEDKILQFIANKNVNILS